MCDVRIKLMMIQILSVYRQFVITHQYLLFGIHPVCTRYISIMATNQKEKQQNLM